MSPKRKRPRGCRTAKGANAELKQRNHTGADAGTQALCLGIAEVARMLGVSERHVERMDASGKLPCPVRLGRAKRWLRADIDVWLAAGCPQRSSRFASRGGVQ